MMKFFLVSFLLFSLLGVSLQDWHNSGRFRHHRHHNHRGYGHYSWTNYGRLQSSFHSEGIVPEIISTPPGEYLHVHFPGQVTARLGNRLTPNETEAEPESLSWSCVEPDALYTLLMIDPDAPSRQEPTFAQVLHWLVINIRGGDLASGQTVEPYMGPAPPEGTGYHRYIQLLFKQEDVLTVEKRDVETEEERIGFNAKEFARKFNLGDPVAGNFFQARNE